LAKGDKQKAENEVARVLLRDPENDEAKRLQGEFGKKE
jgi:hypothetical protein